VPDTVDPVLLEVLLSDPYLALPLPRSTGREHFDAGYARRMVREALDGLPAGVGIPDPARMPTADLVATLTEFTARTVATALAPHGVRRVDRIRRWHAQPRARPTAGGTARSGAARGLAAFGIPPDAKEALLMALLGYLGVHGLPALPLAPDGRTVTGSERPVVLGSLTPPVPVRGIDRGAVPVHRLHVRSPHVPQEDR
jgi:anhydro-N-acetylmuramic acid kinase